MIYNILDDTLLLVAFVMFGYLAYLDIKNKEVTNLQLVQFGIFGFAYRFSIGEFNWLLLFGALFMFILGYVLWNRKAIGGADAKFLPFSLTIFPYHGLGSMVGVIFNFILIFLVIGIVYAFFYTRFSKEKEIPFIPAILLTVIILYLL